jgi:hypothetical protein
MKLERFGLQKATPSAIGPSPILSVGLPIILETIEQ